MKTTTLNIMFAISGIALIALSACGYDVKGAVVVFGACAIGAAIRYCAEHL